MMDLGADRLGANGDLFYSELLRAHRGLTEGESARLNARLVLLLANQVGHLHILTAALDMARKLEAVQLPLARTDNDAS